MPNTWAIRNATSRDGEYLAALDRVDRLPGDADLLGELLLRHLAVTKPQDSDLVADARPRPSHVQIPRR